jgi:multidrug efflux system membrane fusion protein
MHEPESSGAERERNEGTVRPAHGGPGAASHRRRWRWLWLLVLIVAVTAVADAWWRQSVPAGAASPATGSTVRGGGRGGGPPGAIPVVAATAREGSIGVYLDGLGAVTPLSTITVRSRVDGELLAVHFREGETVRKGDLLAEIDPRPFQVQLTQAEGQLVRDQALLDNAKVDLVRYQTLITQNATSEQQLVTQKALIAQYEGAIKTDEGAIDSAKLSLTYSRITAPIAGRIGLRLVDPGNIVHATDTTGLLVITQIEPISVIFTIAEDQLPAVVRKLRAGTTLRVGAYDRDSRTQLASGTLMTVDNQIDPTTGTLKLRAIFDNAKSELFPNQFVIARLLVEEKQGVTLIPTAAVGRNTQMTYVWLVKPDTTVTVRPIGTGVSEGSDTEVTSGLDPGAMVVLTGVDKLQEGVKVRPQTDGVQGRPPQPR